MRILDRYILASFFVDFVIMALLIVGLVLLGDTALKMDEFLENGGWLECATSLGTYVWALLPVLLVSMAPIFTLAAAMLTLTSMGRKKELVAMRASGISPLRIALPIFLASVLISLGMFLVSEVYLPSRSSAVLEAMSLGRGRSEEKLRQLAVDSEGNLFYFERFAPRDGTFQNAWIDRRDPESGKWIGRFYARSGAWLGTRGDEKLVLRDVAEYGPEGNRATFWSERTLETDLLPVDVEEPGARTQFESIAELRRKAVAGSNQRHRLLLQIHSRISHYLFTNWVLLLIALPLALRGADRGRWLGLALTFVILGVYMGVHQTCLSLGERGQISPEAAAWFPVLLFGSVGVCMFANSS